MRHFAAVRRLTLGQTSEPNRSRGLRSASPPQTRPSRRRGLVVEPAAFNRALGLGETGGWFYAVIGAASAITGMISPTIVSGDDHRAASTQDLTAPSQDGSASTHFSPSSKPDLPVGKRS